MKVSPSSRPHISDSGSVDLSVSSVSLAVSVIIGMSVIHTSSSPLVYIPLSFLYRQRYTGTCHIEDYWMFTKHWEFGCKISWRSQLAIQFV